MLTNSAGGQKFNLFIKVVHWRAKLILSVLIPIVLAILVLDWSFVRYRLLDEAIAPNFWGGQKVVTSRWSYLFKEPQKQDLIIYSPSKDVYMPGRVIAVVQDDVAIFNGAIYVNGNPVPNSEQHPQTTSKSVFIRVPQGYVGVLTAEPTETLARFKLVPLNTIKGKIIGPWQVLII